MKKWFALAIVIIFWGILFFVEADLPDFGDINAQANLHVSPYYIENSLEDTETPNFVTAILADYRGYDTLGETTVIFTAGIACILLLMKSRSNED